MEEAVKVKIPETKWANIEIQYSDTTIQVSPYISIKDESHLVLMYIALYFSPSVNPDAPRWNDVIVNLAGNDFWDAEFALRRELLSCLTNVDMENISPEDVFELFDDVIIEVDNYDEFRSRLNKMVLDVKESLALRKSTGYVIDNLSTKILEMLDTLKSINPEEMKQLSSTLLNQMSESPVAEVFKESAKTPKVKKEKVVVKDESAK